MFQRFENFVADTAEALFEETDSDSDDNSIHDHSHETMQTPDKSLNTTIATAKTLSTPTLQPSTSISTKHTTNNAIHTTIHSKLSTRTPTKTPTTTTSIFPNKTISPPSAILSPIRNNPTKTFTSTATSSTTNVTNINHHTNSTVPSRSTRTHFQRSNRNDNYHNKTATTTTPTPPPPLSNDTTVADTTIALLQTDLRQSQQEVQNLRSVLHTFSANADEARVDGQNSLNLQSNKHAHALQLLTTEMVAAKERAQAAETREKQVTDRLNATIEALQQELQEKEHLLRLAKSRADEIENQEMVDRRLVRKVLLQYVGGDGTGRMQQPRRVSNEDPVDLLAVILGLDEKQRNALSNGKRRREMGNGNSGLSAMGSFLSDLTGL